MQAVGRILSQGVYTVSGPFHPFGGAVDIVVVEQQDGSFKSSPWYVRFGKFQGVLKAKEKVIDICVNGVLADFQMHLDSKGEAFFLREIDAQEEANLIFPSSSVDDAVDNSLPQSLSSIRSKSCNYDAASEVVGRSSSRGSRILGLVFGRRSLKSQDVEGDVDTQGIGNTVGSLERAEIAANLLDIKWSTNLSEDKGQDVLANSSEDAKVVVENGELNEKVVYDIAESDVQVACVKVEVQACLEKGLNGQEEVSIDNSNETSETSKLGVDCSSGLACVKVEEVQACLEKELNGEGEVSIDNSNEKSETSKLGVDCSSELPCVKVEVQACVEKELNGEEEISIDNSNETSETSKLGVDCSSEQAHELMYLAGPGCEEVHVHVHDKDLQGATVLLAEGTEAEEVIENADLGMPASEVSEFHSQVRQTDCSDSDDIMYSEVIVEEQLTSPKPQTVKMGLGDYSNEKVEPNCVIKPSSCRSLDDQALDENNMKNKDVSSTLSSPLDSVDDCLPRKTSRRSPSPSSEDEKIFFSDLDKSVINDGFERSFSPEHVDKEDHVSYENDTEKLTAISIPIVIPRNEVVGEEVEKYSISLPNISSTSDIMVPHDVRYPLSLSLDSKSTSLPWTFPGKDDDLECLNSDEDKRNQLSHEEPGAKDYNGSGDFKGDPSTHDPPPGGNWRIWPFSLRRAASRKSMLLPPSLSDTKNTTFVNSPENTISVDMDKTDLKPNIMKKKVKEMAPTSEQVASLNLKNGMNTVTFTFSTAVLGKQQVDCRIYLWKWNTRIVISDVDGTITRSDVLGQFMPLVGIDWSQTGVAHLFSAIKENGYQLLFLSARSISQAYITRQFLLNLKQDGKVLPDGPVVISPDGLFPSLYREVIRRVPHEFKIACLEDIKALFPSDSNPFYAGFGNRDTDEISYLKVGIPLGKIFIINPKGEVVVNRRVETKSYTSLHAHVNGMFPPTDSAEQEDFNSWNFWKLPPPAIDF